MAPATRASSRLPSWRSRAMALSMSSGVKPRRGEALPELGFGQLAAGELLEGGQIGRISQTS